MKKLFTIILILFAFLSNAQITAEQTTKWTYEKDTMIILGSYLKPYNGVKIDSVMRITTEFPTFIDASLVKQVWREKSYKNSVQIKGKEYRPVKIPYFYMKADFTIDLCQKVRIYINEPIEKNPDGKLWDYFKYARDKQIKPVTFWNHDLVQGIINPVIITKDTIQ